MADNVTPPVSDTQLAILAFLRERIEQDGMPPSQLEICAAFGFRQNATAAYHLRALEAAGLIERMPHQARGIRLVGAGMPAKGIRRHGGSYMALPVLGRVAAGAPIGADIGSDEQLLLDRHCFDPMPDYLLRVQGDSMRATTMRPLSASCAPPPTRCCCCRAIPTTRQSWCQPMPTSRSRACTAAWSGGADMGAVLSLDGLLGARRVWRGSPAQAPVPADALPTGCDALDAVLPSGGWPPSALSEILLPADGVGELQLAWPVLARLSRAGRTVVLVAPPYDVHAPAWAAAGIDLAHLQRVHAEPREALWAAEQCLRAGACGAVLCWPAKADDRALRRLQVAAEAGQCIGLAFRPLQAAVNPSPAALRVAIDPPTATAPRQLRVLKCRGATVPARPVPFPARAA